MVRHAILAWKDHGDEECDAVFASLLADSVVRILHASHVSTTHLALVPAPSSVSSMHRRGRWQMLPIAKAMARDLHGYGFSVVVRPVLQLEGVHSKSVQASNASARSRRIAGHVRVAEDLVDDGSLFIVVDDIVTTGATMRHCMDALRSAGVQRVMGCVLACTPNPSPDTKC
ncbi:phosphoribosyltransferase family protein [Bifidobacterium sp. ESL0682]|uniref:ComF family protein n=1 Tax=Bifidobacterium sp. ESL0682 TaxID=2983212 RepID=UPI0023F644E9|nr:phosphoribosyltransferase family protein [Bifidobacterium sp. ESL0682]WEV42515.1 phosphoribosyltransferase family protein [Bifidobacterium sp. ESL0682]